MSEVKKDTNQANSAQESGLGMLVRIFWMMFGNLILILLLVGIFYSEKRSLSLKDYIYWVIVILLIITRYVDIKYLGGLTAKGSPASISVWYRYAIVLVIGSGSLWGLAHITKYFFS